MFLFFLLLFSTTFLLEPDAAITSPWLPDAGLLPEGASPAILSIFVFFFLALFVFLGGFPLVAFFFLWVGGSPCCVFPVFSPRFLGGRGGVFFFCYLLHLASFSLRCRVGQHGLPTRKPPGPSRPFPWRVCPYPSPAGSRRVDAPRQGRGGDRGVCDPAQLPRHYHDMAVHCFVCSRGAPHPPESTLAVSPVLESILGVWLFFVCNNTT